MITSLAVRSDQNSAAAIWTAGTFCEDLDDVTGVEAELVCVLGVIGVERSALRGSGFWFGSTRPRRRFHFLGAPSMQPGGEERDIRSEEPQTGFWMNRYTD